MAFFRWVAELSIGGTRGGSDQRRCCFGSGSWGSQTVKDKPSVTGPEGSFTSELVTCQVLFIFFMDS